MANRFPSGAGPLSVPQPNSPEDRLESWKEIANYLRRSMRTVQEWERSEGMPVYRLQHSKSGSVFAFRSELDKWQAHRTVTGQAAGIPVPENGSQAQGHGMGEEIAPRGEARSSRRWIFLVLATATGIGLIFVGWNLNRTPGPTPDYIQITNFTDWPFLPRYPRTVGCWPSSGARVGGTTQARST